RRSGIVLPSALGSESPVRAEYPGRPASWQLAERPSRAFLWHGPGHGETPTCRPSGPREAVEPIGSDSPGVLRRLPLGQRPRAVKASGRESLVASLDDTPRS